MRETRFITADEIDYVRTIFRLNPNAVGIIQTEQMQERYLTRLAERLAIDEAHAAVTFEDGEPIVVYVGFKFSKIGGWHVGLTKITEKYNHYNKSAPIMAEALDLLIEKMESHGYYKFWMTAPESHHNIRNKIMRKHSKYLDRYVWYDETVIPANGKSGIDSFDAVRTTVDWTDVVVRMFVLDQKHRVDLLRRKGFNDYKGTIL
jgi:hypothetical protein